MQSVNSAKAGSLQPISIQSPALYFGHRHHIVPLTTDRYYIPIIESICDVEDVSLVIPTIEELDIVAPDAADAAGTRTFTSGPVSMKVSGDLRDAMTGKVVGRVIMYRPAERYPFNELREANRVSNAHEQRLVFAEWSRLVREALNVAKAERPRTPATAAPQ